MPSQLVGELSAFFCVFTERAPRRFGPELGDGVGVNPPTAASLVLEQFEHVGFPRVLRRSLTMCGHSEAGQPLHRAPQLFAMTWCTD